MIGVAWRMLRRQTGTHVGALLMSVIGAALLTAFVVVQDSVSQTSAPVERYAAAPIVVGGASGALTPETVRAIGAVPGVAEAVPEVTFPASVLDGGQPLIDQKTTAQFGHAWTSSRLTPFGLVDGRAPTARDEVVLDAALAAAADVRVGSPLRVAVAGASYDLTVSGTVAAESGDLEFQHTLFFEPRLAAELADRGHGRVDAVGVLLDPGADPATVAAEVDRRVTAALAADVPDPNGLPTHHVSRGAERGELEGVAPSHRASAQAMTMLVWIVAFMAAAVIYGALVTSVRRRARQFSLLRAVGATPRQVLVLCHAEAFLLSLVAIAAGGLAGTGLAWTLVEAFRALDLISPMLTVHYGVMPVVLAGVLVLVVCQVAAGFTARSALRFRPGDALAGRDAAGATRRRARLRNASGVALLGSAGLLQLAGMAGMVPAALYGSYGTIASALVIVGVALLGSSIIHLVATLLRRPVGALSPVGGHLAAANVRYHHRRFAGVAAPFAVGVAIAGWALSGLPLFALANAELDAERFAADHVVTTPLVRDRHTGLSEATRRAVEKVPGVTATAATRQTWLHAAPAGDGRPASVETATRATVVSGRAGALLGLGTVSGDLGRVDAGDGIALGSTYAAARGVALGDTVDVRVTAGSTPVTLPVIALFERDRGGQEAAVVADRALGAHAGRQWYDYLLVDGTVAPGALQAAVAGDLSARTHDEFLTAYVDERRGAVDNLGTLAVALVGVFLVIAAVNALALSAADRSDELSSMRRLSATPRQVRSMVGWEMTLTVVPAWLLGVAATLWMAFAMAGGDLGAALWAFPAAVLVAIGLFGLVLAVGGSLTATRSVQRTLDGGGRT